MPTSPDVWERLEHLFDEMADEIRSERDSSTNLRSALVKSNQWAYVRAYWWLSIRAYFRYSLQRNPEGWQVHLLTPLGALTYSHWGREEVSMSIWKGWRISLIPRHFSLWCEEGALMYRHQWEAIIDRRSMWDDAVKPQHNEKI